MIVHLFYIPSKGADIVPIECATLVSNKGMMNDYHFDSNKPLMVISKKLYDSLKKEEGLCYARFKSNIVIEDELIEGNYRIGECIISISRYHKKCFEDCYRNNRNSCPLKNGVFIGKVIQGGCIKIKDKVEILR